MEPNSTAEELPALYRAILDRVAELESTGARAEAARLRASATRHYSRAWDARARRDLEALLRGATDRPGPFRMITRRRLRSGSTAPS
jgi:hypothetical protein